VHPCPDCGCHVHRADPSCPHCGTRISSKGGVSTFAAALLGLAVACSGKDVGGSDTGTTTTATTDDGTTPQPAYGVTTTYVDGGYTVDSVDYAGDADADTDSDSDADSDADTDSGTYTSGSGGGVEPLYGVTATGGTGR
jgi:hypothetical protein